jgi:hypothetical protein
MAKDIENKTEQELRLECLQLAQSIAYAQAATISDEDKKAQSEVNLIQDTLRNAKRLWKFVKVDPVAEKEESE